MESPRQGTRPIRLVAHPAARRTLLPWLGLGAVLGVAYYFRDLLILFGAAASLAWLLEPLVVRLERKGAPRALAIVVVLLGIGVVLTLVGWFVVPGIVEQFTSLIGSLPGRIRDQWLPAASRGLLYVRQRYHVRIPVSADAWLTQLGVRASEIPRSSMAVVLSAASASVSVLEYVVESVIVLAMSFYLLSDWHGLTEGVVDLVPRRAESEFRRIAGRVNESLGRYVRGQFLAMAVLGGLFAVGLEALGVPGGFGLGILFGMLTVVPYVGFFLALGLALLLAAIDGHVSVLAVGIYMGVVHVLDITLVTPRILGGSIGLSPVTVILSLLAGARLMGFTGLLFAIPVASVLRVLISELVAWYRGTFFYTATPATDDDAVDVAVVEAHMPPPRSARATIPEPDGTLPRDREPLMSLEDASKRTTVVQGTPGAGPRE